MANCTTCGTCQQDCQCIPAGMTTPSYCPADSPTCPTPNPCAETFDSQCIIYKGDDLTCLGVNNGDSIQTVIQTIASALDPFLCLECASLAIPSNGSTNVNYDQSIFWNAVPAATSYNVYFGTNPVNPPQVATGQIATSWTSPTPLLENTTYYWKVVPINASGSASNCPVYSFTTKANTCINPIEQLLENIYNSVEDASSNIRNFITGISKYLEDGELLTNCNLCCPDCTQTHRYVLASAPIYADYYSQVYNITTCPPVCCTEVAAGITAMTTAGKLGSSLQEVFIETPPVTNCCDTNFSNCVQALKTEVGSDLISFVATSGIIEESTISGSTTVCVLLNFLNNLPGIYTNADKAEIVQVLLDAGVVIDCRPEGTIIASMDTYLQYLTTAQNGCLCYLPCNV